LLKAGKKRQNIWAIKIPAPGIIDRANNAVVQMKSMAKSNFAERGREREGEQNRMDS
jgi:hypothetical protein